MTDESISDWISGSQDTFSSTIDKDKINISIFSLLNSIWMSIILLFEKEIYDWIICGSLERNYLLVWRKG